MSIILKCSCDSYLGNKSAANFQDTKYGHGNRVHNRLAGTDTKYRCTVCESERGDPGHQQESKKKGK